MIPQQQMIARLRSSCQRDERVVAGLLYGSFATGEADSFSDVECALFVDAVALPHVDRRAWVEQIAPLHLWFADEFGHHTAIFDGLVRGEFHFLPDDQIGSVAQWSGNVWFSSADECVLLDRNGHLAAALETLIGPAPERHTAQMVEGLLYNFINLTILGGNVLARGELARALDLLNLIDRKLLHMARLVERSTAHWPTPSRKAEQELSPPSYARFRTCTSGLDPGRLRSAYRAAWTWGIELADLLTARHAVALPRSLVDQVSDRLGKIV